MPANVAEFGRRVAKRLAGELGSDVIGVYFVGSVALGGYVPGESDIDMLAVSDRALADDERRAIAASVVDVARRCPTRGVEFTLYRPEIVRLPPVDADFELNANGGPRMRTATHVDCTAEPGFWYVLDRAIVRRSGLVVVGAPPGDVFAEVRRSTLLEAMRASMVWHRTHEGATLYSVLNACRAWRFADEGVLGSKLAGAAWARDRWPDPGVIDAAVALRHGQHAPLDGWAVDGLLSAVTTRLERASTGPLA